MLKLKILFGNRAKSEYFRQEAKVLFSTRRTALNLVEWGRSASARLYSCKAQPCV